MSLYRTNKKLPATVILDLIGSLSCTVNLIQINLMACLKCQSFFRNNGTCFRQCQGRSVALSSLSSSLPLSSSLGWHGSAGGQDGLSHCLWVLSVSPDLAPCMPGQMCPPVALTLHKDSYTQCTVRAISYIRATYELNAASH